MSDMRPISLFSVQYKIVSKIFCNRLKHILHGIISETQGAFVSSRLISDNILIAHEMVHGLKVNARVSDGFMAIKTYMSKANDRVQWNFLKILMEKTGFAHGWIKWIMACVSSVSFSVLMNGNEHGLLSQRGVSDKVIPYLHSYLSCVLKPSSVV